MDKDKAIRSAKLTAAGLLDKARARTAVTRAGGQIAPSKYMPNVPRAVHAAGEAYGSWRPRRSSWPCLDVRTLQMGAEE
jgi:hypothetical protein